VAVDQWPVVIRDHHPGYLEWASYLRHLSMIESNAYMKPGARSRRRSVSSRTAAVPTVRPYTQISYSGRDSALRTFAVCGAITRQQRGLRVLLRPGGGRRAVGQQILQAIAPQAIDAAMPRRSGPASGIVSGGRRCARARTGAL
jgi:hypothetical protein